MSVKVTIRDAASVPRVTVVPNPNLKGPSMKSPCPHNIADRVAGSNECGQCGERVDRG